MKHLKYIVALLILTMMSGSLISQDRPYRRLKSHENLIRLENEDSNLEKKRQQIEKKISKEKNKELKLDTPTIAMVFHVLYQNENEKISESQILSQIEALNRDFSLPPELIDHEVLERTSFSQKAAQLAIKFCLTSVDDNNNSTTGINYIQVDRSNWTYDDDIKNNNMGTESWQPDKMINVWVGHLADTVSGYAQMPGGDKKTDGIVVDYRYVGIGGTSIAPYDEGKTLTHLIGNYFNLYSLWGKYDCTDDYVDDTPIHNLPYYGCPEYERISTCDGYPTAMIINFMDNTDDYCLSMFTYGQRNRIYAALIPGGERASLLSNNTQCNTEPNQSITSRGSEESENDLVASQSIKLFPNPTKGFIHVTIEQLDVTIESIDITDISGRTLYNNANAGALNNQSEFIIDTKDWPSGFYLIRISGENFEWTNKIIVEK